MSQFYRFFKMFAFSYFTLLILVTPSQGLDCYRCNLQDNPKCGTDYPPKGKEKELIIQCHPHDQGCITYSYKLADGRKMGGQRCICKAEMECFEEQEVKLGETNKETTHKISLKDFAECMDNIIKAKSGGGGENSRSLAEAAVETDSDPSKVTEKSRRRRDSPKDTSVSVVGNVGNSTNSTERPTPKPHRNTTLTITFCSDDACNAKRNTTSSGTRLTLGLVTIAIPALSHLIKYK